MELPAAGRDVVDARDSASKNSSVPKQNGDHHDGSQSHPLDVAIQECGLADAVFPLGMRKDAEGHVVFEDKLRQFVFYNPLQVWRGINNDPDAILLSSPEGRALFREALDTPYMEIYFTVSPQIDNQPEDTCSSLALVVALNSLAVHPGRATWYHQYCWNGLHTMACCTAVLKNPNMNLHQIARLAVCNDMRAFPVAVTAQWTEDSLRPWVKMAASRNDVIMVMNYGRGPMGQDGIGHFLPLAGYHEGSDRILVVDTAKQKYLPQWSRLGRLLEAMRATDFSTTGQHRGFFLLMGADHDTSRSLFRPSLRLRMDDSRKSVDPTLEHFACSWNRNLDSVVPDNTTAHEVISSAIRHLLATIQQDHKDGAATSLFEMNLVHFRCERNGRASIIARCHNPQCTASCPYRRFHRDLQATELFKFVQCCLGSGPETQRCRILDLIVSELSDIDQAVSFAKDTCEAPPSRDDIVKFYKRVHRNGTKQDCPGYVELLPEHIATFFLMSWPYCHDSDNCLGQKDFLPLLKSHSIDVLEPQTNGSSEHSPPTEPQRSENSVNGEGRSLRRCLDAIVWDEVDRMKESREVKEQTRAMRRKLDAVLDYFYLQK